MKEYKYDISVIMAVCNAEQYLREAVGSLVHQTLGFSRIQLIIVDDGSEDGSRKICDEYQMKYPDNVVVIHKENGGVFSARNAGLQYVQGQYFCFMDGDGRFAHDAFQKVCHFFKAHENGIDIVSVPVIYLDPQTGEHPANKIFSSGEDVLDLFETTDAVHLGADSAFIREEAAAGQEFDTRLKVEEDTKYLLEILLKKMKLGLLGSTVYWCQKRKKSEDSAARKPNSIPEWYTTRLKLFSAWALDTAQEQYGQAPVFVQNEVMYDLKSKIMQKKIPEDILDAGEEKEYRDLLFNLIKRIDDTVILGQRGLGVNYKNYILTRKHGDGPQLREIPPDQQEKPSGRSGTALGKETLTRDIGLYFGDLEVIKVSGMRTVLDFISIDPESGICVIEGYHVLYGMGQSVSQPFLLVNGEPHPCGTVDRMRKTSFCLGDAVDQVIGFRGSFLLSENVTEVLLAVGVCGKLVVRTEVSVGQFFPVCKKYDNSWALSGNCMISLKEDAVLIRRNPSLPERFVREGLFLAEIWRKNLLGGRKAVFGRLYYHLMNPLKTRQIWIVSDRIMKADDNGEALFRYLQKNKPAKTRVVFAISKKSTDFRRISQMGECVDAMSFRHKLLHLLCDVNLSSQASNKTGNPFMGYHDALRDLLLHQKFVFLQHGITKDDQSNWLNKYNRNLSGIITAADREQESFIKGSYGYHEKEIWLTGFPRFDYLYTSEKKWITVMPSWRKYLTSEYNEKTGIWCIGKGFEESAYYRAYNELLNSEKLLSALDKYGYRLQFFPHPNIRPYIRYFNHDPRTGFLDSTVSYRDVYAFSDLVVTDYSSAVFDFAYLRKPILYCQFDKDEFFSGKHSYTQGYFDYEDDGFGEVAYSIEDTIDLIIGYARENCKLKDKYRQRINDFFAFNDQENCKRVVEKILGLHSF